MLPFWKRGLSNGIETKVWDKRILLDKLVGLSVIPRLLSLIQGREVSQRKRFEGRRLDWKENSTQEI